MSILYTLLAISAHFTQSTGSHAVSPTTAEPTSWSVAVQTGDLDLTHAADRKRLDRRIMAAADKACGRVVQGHDLHEAMQCQVEAFDGARHQIDDLIVRAFYAETEQPAASSAD